MIVGHASQHFCHGRVPILDEDPTYHMPVTAPKMGTIPLLAPANDDSEMVNEGY